MPLIVGDNVFLQGLMEAYTERSQWVIQPGRIPLREYHVIANGDEFTLDWWTVEYMGLDLCGMCSHFYFMLENGEGYKDDCLFGNICPACAEDYQGCHRSCMEG